MQIIILIFLSLSAFAQEKCDPVEAERKCFSELCNSKTENPFLMAPEALRERVAAEPDSEELKRTSAIIAKKSEHKLKIQSVVNELLAKKKPLEFADMIIADPVNRMGTLEELVREEIRASCSSGVCEIKTNNLIAFTDGFKKFYKTLKERTLIFRLNGLDLKIALANLVVTLQSDLPDTNVLKERDRILKHPLDGFNSFEKFPWVEAYKKKISEELRPYRHELEAVLRRKMTEAAAVGITKQIQATVSECKLAYHLQRDVEGRVTEEKFKKIIDDVTQSVKKKFLPKLSPGSAKTLSKKLSSDLFELVPQSSVDSGVRNDSFQQSFDRPKEDFDILNALQNVQGSQTRCYFDSLHVGDKFTEGTAYSKEKIHVSRFTLAYDGKDVIFHEVGHWVSTLLLENKLSHHTRQRLLEVRKCVQGYYPKSSQRSGFVLRGENDKLTTEEDFADWFEAVVGTQDNILHCDFTRMVPNVDGIRGEIYKPMDGRSHSGDLFRVLGIRLNSGLKIPPVCKDLIDAYPDFAPTKCSF